jgi:uncharacterized protein YigE (DUF2233 family)
MPPGKRRAAATGATKVTGRNRWVRVTAIRSRFVLVGGSMRRTLIALLCLLTGLACQAADQRFIVVKVDVRHEYLELFLDDASGTPLNGFDRLVSWLKGRNKQLLFGMNAGMYNADFSPVGLLVVNGKQVSPLNLADGPGNFFWKPNGVFLVSKSGPHIVESSEYPSVAIGVRIATQSGPLLVRHGVIHPGFSPGASSRLIRNGVGVSGSMAVFVISLQPVNFHEFATFFRDDLHCQDALYLDGVVSSLYSARLGRNDHKTKLGPMVGVIR